eukprot:scaffold7474_cov63-Phaeocystis_antarctica.AAC.11
MASCVAAAARASPSARSSPCVGSTHSSTASSTPLASSRPLASSTASTMLVASSAPSSMAAMSGGSSHRGTEAGLRAASGLRSEPVPVAPDAVGAKSCAAGGGAFFGAAPLRSGAPEVGAPRFVTRLAMSSRCCASCALRMRNAGGGSAGSILHSDTGCTQERCACGHTHTSEPPRRRPKVAVRPTIPGSGGVVGLSVLPSASPPRARSVAAVCGLPLASGVCGRGSAL